MPEKLCSTREITVVAIDFPASPYRPTGISNARRAYLAAGGLGVLVGDGALLRKSREAICESYYSATLSSWAHITHDGQPEFNLGYNTDRGPVVVLGVRLHLAR